MDIQVGDRVTYIETSVILGKYRGYGLGLNTKEVKNKVTEIVINNNKEFKEVLKIERIGSKGWYTVYEKKKKLLTIEEKEFLHQYSKLAKAKIADVEKEYDGCIKLWFKDGRATETLKLDKEAFKRLENGETYLSKELGLE